MGRTQIAAQKGFTLLELLIAISILAFISIGVYQITAKTFSMRSKLGADAEFYNLVRGSLDLMRRDLIHIYTPQLSALPASLSQKQVVNAGDNTFDPGQPTAYWSLKVNNFNIRPSRFAGDNKSMTFISNGHVRLYEDIPESEFTKLKFEIQDDDVNKAEGLKAITRISDPNAFPDENRKSDTEQTLVILRRVKFARFRYLDGEQDQWFDTWDSSRAEMQNRFPSLIEVSIEVVPSPPLPPNATLAITQLYKPELAL